MALSKHEVSELLNQLIGLEPALAQLTAMAERLERDESPMVNVPHLNKRGRQISVSLSEAGFALRRNSNGAQVYIRLAKQILSNM